MKYRKTFKNLFIFIISVFILNSCKNKEAEALNNIENDVFVVSLEKIKKRTIKEEIVLSANIKGLEEAIIYPRTTGKLIKNILREGDKVKKDETISLIKKDEVGVVYEPAPVPSTLEGEIGRIYQDIGADINMQTPIALVVNQNKVRVQMEIPERDSSKVHLNQKVLVKVEAYPNKIFSGKINKISPVVNINSRTTFVEALIENENKELKSGMFCIASIILKEMENVPSIPIISLVYEKEVPYVYILNENSNTAKKIKADIGLKDSNYIQVKNLKADDLVIVSGLYGIHEGAKVKIYQEEN